METENHIYDDCQEKYNRFLARLEDTREQMEIETQIFIEAAKQFTLVWTRREIEHAILPLENTSSSKNSALDNEMLSQLNSGLKELPFRVPDIIDSYLDRDDCWIHRKAQPFAGISRDYIEFKKDKMLKDLTVSIRLILGCSTEILDDLNDGKPEEKGWVKERGKRKYICFLRFSDEMTASLNRYFERLEDFFILNHEIKEESQRLQESKRQRALKNRQISKRIKPKADEI
jgi:hypothetical protein